MNNLRFIESFSEASENTQIFFGRWAKPPWLDPLLGHCPGPTGGLGGPLDPRPNLLFSKMTLLFHFIMKSLGISGTILFYQCLSVHLPVQNLISEYLTFHGNF